MHQGKIYIYRYNMNIRFPSRFDNISAISLKKRVFLREKSWARIWALSLQHTRLTVNIRAYVATAAAAVRYITAQKRLSSASVSYYGIITVISEWVLYSPLFQRFEVNVLAKSSFLQCWVWKLKVLCAVTNVARSLQI